MKKIIISIIIISTILIFGRKGLLYDTVDVVTYDIFHNKEEKLSVSVFRQNETSYDFYMLNKSPVDIIVKFNSSGGDITNDVYRISSGIERLITLKIVNITENGMVDINYEVEIQ